MAVGPAGNGARQTGGASPVTTHPDKFRLGAGSPGRRWKGRRQSLQSTHKGKKLLSWVGKGGRKVSRAWLPSVDYLTLAGPRSSSMT